VTGSRVDIEGHCPLVLDGSLDAPISPWHDRRVSPAQTLRALTPLFKDLGITRLGEITGLDTLGVPVACAIRPNSFSLSVSLGKGLDRESAYASAAMEAAEIAVAERFPAASVYASLEELENRGKTAIDLTRMARCVPERLDPETRIAWVEGFDLISPKRILVPWALVGLDHRLTPEGFHDAFEVSSDGLASGNSTAEAVLHGMCELIERDAYALFELLPEHVRWSRLCAPRRSDDPQLGDLLRSVERAGLRLQLFDMTTDLQVPSYMAVLWPSSDEKSPVPTWASVCGGCGCHPLSTRAIIRALTEAVQARAALVAGARDDFAREHYCLIERPGDMVPEVFTPAGREVLRPPLFQGNSPYETIGQRISQLLRTLLAAGVSQVVAVELPTDDWSIKVVRVLIPDLQIPLHGRRTQVTCRGLRQLLGLAQ
jgi:YcaO-like protein with predicted kinase domain